ncbi:MULTISPECIES: PhzF family phenazine biosynthesis protein [unclassified Psychrobacter]|jgi:PhzF family phenazine biosynthesis protein|uniref:PhzF family phenazine biosynthesis protein n=1 Tax=unclassified Psychrobacter TaxID=196806 RepID=UPI00191B81A9|nr:MULTISPECIES: PhzF family phenazine biosynthesis protein [unclassified Psychrobacter]MCG3871362.1 PhzF family phenazine biosynthesis protein [Psychrobacter sp. Ps7]MDN5561576.1 PhzF family phenazine biosynthesis protein [Psychrobacter sp.]
MQLEINVIDAFTDTVFKGNSAAVVITEDWLSDNLMQSIAFENNLSETAFMVLDDKGIYHIRWFSPLTEIAFCGHATLASAFVLFNKNPSIETIKFSAKAVGILTIVQTETGKIQMDFPNTNPKKVDNIPDSLLAGLSIAPVEVYKNTQAYFVIYNAESDVLTVARDNEQLKQLAPLDVVVTCQAKSAGYKNYDFISRYFWPANGGDEDPVTGSAHTALAPLWAERLGKNHLVAYQASRRGGVLDCVVAGDRVMISGNAVQYMTGFITV